MRFSFVSFPCFLFCECVYLCCGFLLFPQPCFIFFAVISYFVLFTLNFDHHNKVGYFVRFRYYSHSPTLNLSTIYNLPDGPNFLIDIYTSVLTRIKHAYPCVSYVVTRAGQNKLLDILRADPLRVLACMSVLYLISSTVFVFHIYIYTSLYSLKCISNYRLVREFNASKY